MHRFWNKAIEPLLASLDAATVVEIGIDQGDTTRLLLERANRMGRGVVHAIDPEPKLDVPRWQMRYGSHLALHRERSHDALKGIGEADAVLIDGDHNWVTVSGELELIAEMANRDAMPLPLIMIHDVGWPYGRRDMYYDLRGVPREDRQEAAKLGVLPGKRELSADGVNSWLWNARQCGGARNGVLTAVEDFVAGRDDGFELVVVDGFHGLGILASRERLEASAGLRAELSRLRSPEFAREWARTLERARVEAEIQAWWAMGRPKPGEATGA